MTQKKQAETIETRLKKSLERVYKFVSSLSEIPSLISIEREFLSLTYTGKNGLVRMCIGLQESKKEGPQRWFDDVECFSIEYDSLVEAHKAKNIEHARIEDGSRLKFKSTKVVSVPVWQCREGYDPIGEIANALEWTDVDLSCQNFKKATDFARLDLNTGIIYDAGTVAIKEKEANVLVIGKRLIPKYCLLSKGYVSFTQDTNFRNPYLLFTDDQYATLITYPKVLDF
jgi:hypothetical protein